MATLNLLGYTLPELLIVLAASLVSMEDERATPEELDELWDLMTEINRRRKIEELHAPPDLPRPSFNPPI